MHRIQISSIVLGVVALISGACFTGPNYKAVAIYPNAEKPTVRLVRFSTFEFFRKQVQDQTNFIAEIRLHSGESGAGTVQISSVHRIDNDDADHRSQFFPIVGTDKWVHLYTDAKGTTKVILRREDGKSEGTLTSFSDDRSIVNYVLEHGSDGYALTRSGRYLLVATTPNQAELWDVPGKRLLERDTASVLGDIHRCLADHYGSRWWLTDDLRYVVILPAVQMYHFASIDEAPHRRMAKFAGVDVDINSMAIVYDRLNRSVSVTAGELNGLPILDAEDVDDRLEFIYGGYDKEDFRMVVTDDRGLPLNDAVFPPEQALRFVRSSIPGSPSVSKWDPQANEIWFFDGRSNDDPNSESHDKYMLCQWNYRSNKISYYRLDYGQIVHATAWKW